MSSKPTIIPLSPQKGNRPLTSSSNSKNKRNHSSANAESRSRLSTADQLQKKKSKAKKETDLREDPSNLYLKERVLAHSLRSANIYKHSGFEYVGPRKPFQFQERLRLRFLTVNELKSISEDSLPKTQPTSSQRKVPIACKASIFFNESKECQGSEPSSEVIELHCPAPPRSPSEYPYTCILLPGNNRQYELINLFFGMQSVQKLPNWIHRSEHSQSLMIHVPFLPKDASDPAIYFPVDSFEKAIFEFVAYNTIIGVEVSEPAKICSAHLSNLPCTLWKCHSANCPFAVQYYPDPLNSRKGFVSVTYHRCITDNRNKKQSTDISPLASYVMDTIRVLTSLPLSSHHLSTKSSHISTTNNNMTVAPSIKSMVWHSLINSNFNDSSTGHLSSYLVRQVLSARSSSFNSSPGSNAALKIRLSFSKRIIRLLEVIHGYESMSEGKESERLPFWIDVDDKSLAVHVGPPGVKPSALHYDGLKWYGSMACTQHPRIYMQYVLQLYGLLLGRQHLVTECTTLENDLLYSSSCSNPSCQFSMSLNVNSCQCSFHQHTCSLARHGYVTAHRVGRDTIRFLALCFRLNALCVDDQTMLSELIDCGIHPQSTDVVRIAFTESALICKRFGLTPDKKAYDPEVLFVLSRRWNEDPSILLEVEAYEPFPIPPTGPTIIPRSFLLSSQLFDSAHPSWWPGNNLADRWSQAKSCESIVISKSFSYSRLDGPILMARESKLRFIPEIKDIAIQHHLMMKDLVGYVRCIPSNRYRMSRNRSMFTVGNGTMDQLMECAPPIIFDFPIESPSTDAKCLGPFSSISECDYRSLDDGFTVSPDALEGLIWIFNQNAIHLNEHNSGSNLFLGPNFTSCLPRDDYAWILAKLELYQGTTDKKLNDYERVYCVYSYDNDNFGTVVIDMVARTMTYYGSNLEVGFVAMHPLAAFLKEYFQKVIQMPFHASYYETFFVANTMTPRPPHPCDEVVFHLVFCMLDSHKLPMVMSSEHVAPMRRHFASWLLWFDLLFETKKKQLVV